MNKNVRKLTEGAMMAAMIGVFLLINRQTAGILIETLLFLFPLPLAVFSARYGWKDSLPVLAAVGILSFILSTPQTIFYVLSEAVIGILYGSGIHQKISTRKLVLRTMILAAFVEVVAMVIFASFFGYDIAAEVAELKTVLTTVTESAGNPEMSGVFTDNFLETLFVVSAVMTGVMEGFITHFFSRLLLKRLRIPLPPSEPLLKYFPPKWSGYLGIVGVILYFYCLTHTIENELVLGIMEGFGMMGTLYLAFYGILGMMVALRVFVPRIHPVMMFLVGLLLLSFGTPVLAIAGFLYITTDFHEKALKGELLHAPKNQ